MEVVLCHLARRYEFLCCIARKVKEAETCFIGMRAVDWENAIRLEDEDPLLAEDIVFYFAPSYKIIWTKQRLRGQGGGLAHSS